MAAVALWVKSYWWPDYFDRHPFYPDRRQYREDKVQSHAGRLCLQFVCFSSTGDVLDLQTRARAQGVKEGWRREPQFMFAVPGPQDPHRAWPYLLTYRGQPLSGFIAVIPYWIVVAVTLPLPGMAAAAAARWRRVRRIAAGLCPRCGYDLRASPDRCPECGTIEAT